MGLLTFSSAGQALSAAWGLGPGAKPGLSPEAMPPPARTDRDPRPGGGTVPHSSLLARALLVWALHTFCPSGQSCSPLHRELLGEPSGCAGQAGLLWAGCLDSVWCGGGWPRGGKTDRCGLHVASVHRRTGALGDGYAWWSGDRLSTTCQAGHLGVPIMGHLDPIIWNLPWAPRVGCWGVRSAWPSAHARPVTCVTWLVWGQASHTCLDLERCRVWGAG